MDTNYCGGLIDWETNTSPLFCFEQTLVVLASFKKLSATWSCLEKSFSYCSLQTSTRDKKDPLTPHQASLLSPKSERNFCSFCGQCCDALFEACHLCVHQLLYFPSMLSWNRGKRYQTWGPLPFRPLLRHMLHDGLALLVVARTFI